MGSCSNRSPTTKRVWALGCTTGVCLFAVVLGFIWPTLVWQIAKSEFVLVPGTEIYENWFDPPIDIYLELYLWNWTNAEDYQRVKNYKPHLEQLGPYTFLERHERVNLEWDDEEHTLTFQQRRIWHYVPEKSVGDYENDRVTTINPVLLTVGYALRDSPDFLLMINGIIKLNGLATSPFYDVPVHEVTFDGYDDFLLSSLLLLLDMLPPEQLPPIELPPYDKFGWFFGRNGSETYDGTFTVGTGKDHVQNTGVMRLWNGANSTDYYRGLCGQIRGTTGEVWPPFGRLRGTPPNVSVFAPDVCSTVTLQYLDKVERFRIEGLRWYGNERVFDNGVHYEETACQCTAEDVASCPVLDNGAMDVARCKFGAPATVSFPHFYLANDSYLSGITGMNPNEAEHRFVMELEPYSGVPLNVQAQLQVNLNLRDYGLTLLKGIPEVMLPVLWFRQTAGITEELADDLKLLLLLPDIGVYVAYGIGAVGVIGLVIALYFSVTRWKVESVQAPPPSKTPSE